MMFRNRFLRAFLFIAISTIAFAVAPRKAALDVPLQGAVQAQTGIDVLEAENFAPLRGKRVGLITNQTGVDAQGRRTIDVLAHADGVKLVALFSPEHGMAGNVDAVVANATDSTTGLPIYSLYGEHKRPTDEMLQGTDTLVFDIQGAGVRFYTFITTMGYCMEAAAKHHMAFFVLDRPDPLGGERIEGPMLDASRMSFVGYFPMPLVYGMTLGELARMFNAENKTGVELHVVEMKNWHRSETYDQTGLPWIPPSPNLRSVNEVFLYPGIEILQPAGVSVGRGTDTPFELVGAPWIRSQDLLNSLDPRKIPGVRFTAASFTPTSGLYSGQVCAGLKMEVINRDAFVSVRVGLEVADALHRLYPERFQITKLTDLLGSQASVDALIAYQSPASIITSWTNDLAAFRAMRAKYLIYD